MTTQTEVGTTLKPFVLSDSTGTEFRFPTGRPALLCFVHEECQTCALSLPLIEATHRAFGAAVDVWAIGQDTPGNAMLVERHGLTLPMLDDDALAVSFAYDLDTVPAIFLADGSGKLLRSFVGFGRVDWQDLVADLVSISSLPGPEIRWDGFPESRPGCGSRSVEPMIAERLFAEAEGSPLRARRIEIGSGDDEHEFLFDQGLTDGLPVVPPTPERVLRMLGGTRRDSQEVVAIVPPNLAPVTVEKVAINAVMAGCRPEYLPVVLTAVEAMCTDEFNIHGVSATTMGATPAMIVNGPIRNRIGMNSGLGALGAGNRPNATIGRAIRLVLRNVGGAKTGGTERSTLASPAKFTLTFAEWEERSPWSPYHVDHGFQREDSVVTLFAATGGPSMIVDQTSRTARQLGGSLGMVIEAIAHPRARGPQEMLVVLCPEHLDTITRDGWTKQDLLDRIQEVSAKPLRDLLADETSGVGIPLARFGPDGPTEEQLSQMVPKFASTDNIHLVVAGSDAGKFTSVFQGWASGPRGSMVVSRKIEEV
ncbi:MAG: redoxin domain-containing protein [Dehalococcoidia bacterium]|nr:redoxin domain-containing protein [Dehalococcoidia bacterium]